MSCTCVQEVKQDEMYCLLEALDTVLSEAITNYTVRKCESKVFKMCGTGTGVVTCEDIVPSLSAEATWFDTNNSWL